MCFRDLAQKQEEQIKVQQEQGDRLHKAIEALKPPVPPVLDKKIEFWNSYMKLADEHDKEFQEKYSTDLDTALIFAGLFSAVSSAFIIQIQPQLTTPPGPTRIIVIVQSLLYISLFTALLAALLAVLGKQWIMHYEAAGSRGTIEERGLERQRKLDGLRKWKFDTVLQMFPLLLQIALLLFATALSIYLRTVHHTIAIIVLVLTSFGFASYIFLLLSAIFSPDSPFQIPLSHFLLQLFSPAVKWFIFNSNIRKLRHFVSAALTSWRRSMSSKTILPCVVSHAGASDSPESSDPYAGIYIPDASPEVPAILWVLETSTDPSMISVAAEISVDLQWPLDQDLTPCIGRLADSFNSCFELSIRGSRIVGKMRQGMIRRACSYGRAYCSLEVVARASSIPHTGQWLLGNYNNDELLPAETDDPLQFSDLLSIVQIIRGSMMLDWENPTSVRLALYALPSIISKFKFTLLQDTLEPFLTQFQEDKVGKLDPSSFANYLCCVNSFLTPTSPRVMAQIDKRHFRDVLVAQLFKALRAAPVGTHLTAKIITTTARLANNSVGHYSLRRNFMDLSIVTEACRFCSTFLSLDTSVLVSAAILAKFENVEEFVECATLASLPSLDAEWIYVVMERVQHAWDEKRSNAEHPDEWDSDTTLAVEALLHLLVFSDTFGQKKPPIAAFHIIVRALSAPEDISFAAFIVLHRAMPWFLVPEFKSIMQESGAWAHLGRIALQFSDINPLANWYLDMGKNVEDTGDWKPFIYQDLSTWISVFSGDEWGRHSHSREKFNSVMQNVWVTEFDQQHKFTDDTEESWGLAILALSGVWGNFQFDNCNEFIRLARCTISTALQARYFVQLPTLPHHFEAQYSERIISLNMKATFSSQLGASLNRAAVNARNADPHNAWGPHHSTGLREHILERVSGFLDVLGHKIGTELFEPRAEFEPRSGEVQLGGLTKVYKNWAELQIHFMAELGALEESWKMVDC
ncbi:hypothetical protein FB451DRAFT_1239806 [Mycena latifolia]|nr:hypothetical protein FB451DRAFT_1239806 [Mycena latifolia]